MSLNSKDIDRSKYTVVKWHAMIKGVHLLISEKNEVFYWSGEIYKLKEEYHNGRICFRIPRTTRRFGKRTIRKNCEPCDVLI